MAHRPPGGGHGYCLCSVIMSDTTRHRDRCSPVFLVAAFLVLMLASGAAWPATGGGHGGGSPGGGHGIGRGGGGFARGRGSGGGGFGGRPVPRHDHDGRRFFVSPYFYDPYYGYDAYCDPYSPYYAPQYCYWDGP